MADREFGIGRFYYLRESYPASIARLQSLVDKYPLYSRADEALYSAGAKLRSADRARPSALRPATSMACRAVALRKREGASYIGELTKNAAAAVLKILTRYPLMDRSDDAKKRLAALHQPIPRPTKAAVAQNKAEIESRGETTTMQRMMGLIKKGPDVAAAAQHRRSHPGRSGSQSQRPAWSRQRSSRRCRHARGWRPGEKSVGVEIISKPGTDLPPAVDSNASGRFAVRRKTTVANPTPPTPANSPDPNELKPNAAPADPNELKPADTGSDQPLPPPTQVNEIQQGRGNPRLRLQRDFDSRQR